MKPFLQNKRVLFIRLRLLGDIIFTIPSIILCRKYLPSVKIYYLVEEEFKEIGELIPEIDCLMVIPRKMRLVEMWKFKKMIDKLNIETVIDFHSGPKSGQLTWITNAKKRIGYQTPFRNWPYNLLSPRKFDHQYTHSVYNQAKLLEFLGISIQMDVIPSYPEINVKEEKVSEIVKAAIKRDKKVVLHIGAGNAFRDWGIENFSALIQKLKQQKISVYLIGYGKAEMKRGEYFSSEYGAEDFTGKLSISDLFYLISKADVYMGADSGPLHLASLTATPIVALYGPNIPEISGPWRQDDVTIIQHQLKCQPCDQRNCIYGIIPCMKNIKSEQVYEAISGYFK